MSIKTRATFLYNDVVMYCVSLIENFELLKEAGDSAGETWRVQMSKLLLRFSLVLLVSLPPIIAFLTVVPRRIVPEETLVLIVIFLLCSMIVVLSTSLYIFQAITRRYLNLRNTAE